MLPIDLDEFTPKIALWIPCAGFAERMRPYTYIRAKGMLPIMEKGLTICEDILEKFVRVHTGIDLVVVTTYYRPYDFKELRIGLSSFVVLDFNTEVLHGTACDFDLLRIYFPSVDTWIFCLGDLIIQNPIVIEKLKDFDNAIIIGEPNDKPSGMLYSREGCQWFREKKPDDFGDATVRKRWRGIFKVTISSLFKEIPNPYLCSKGSRHRYHGKSFQEVYMEALVGNFGLFRPVHAEEGDIINVGTKEIYENYLGKTEREIMDFLR